MKKSLSLQFIALFIVAFSMGVVAQQRTNKCATVKMHTRNLANKPGMAERVAASETLLQQAINAHMAGKVDTLPTLITVPVVVHVIYHDSVQNISDAQVLSQIARLNLDYRKLNSDTLAASHPYHQFIADAGFEFCLAQLDPNDIATTGITRTYTTRVNFNPDTDNDDYMKFTSDGGIDAWDVHKYLNIWVVNIDPDNGTLGYTSYPSDLADYPEYDGCVIDYRVFGTTGTVATPLDLGRTTTHEVGHWLDLIHIWGDDPCASDSVADTPTQEDADFDCPVFPVVSCSNGPNGNMYMNYMDYVNDGCMNMFTTGQAARMRAAFNQYRTSILSQTSRCQSPVHTGVESAANVSVTVSPNPSSGAMTVRLGGFTGKANMALYDMLGREVWANNDAQGGTDVAVRVENAVAGMYVLKVKAGSETLTRKVIVR